MFGNRRQKQADNGGNPFPQIWTEVSDIAPTTNRLTNGVIYDDAGNVETDQKYRHLKFEYDANNRQKQSSNLDGTGAVKSIYDAAGQRVATQIAGALTNVLVYDAMGKLVAEYGSSPSANGTQYVMADHQGSTRAVLNNAGTVISRHDYLPFGEEVDAEVGMRAEVPGYNVADGVRQKYAGMETDDATRLAHTLWRQYDSLSGRWTAPDPYGGSMTVADPQSFNRYSYVNNDPVNLTDPLGLMAASVGWTGASAGFWGSDLNNFDPHFGGPANIAEAETRHDNLVKARTDGMLALKYLQSGNTSAANRIFESNSNVGRIDGNGNILWGSAASFGGTEIRVAEVALLEGTKENSPVVGKGNVDPLENEQNPSKYVLDVNQGHVDYESSIFTISVTFQAYHIGEWDRGSLRVNVSPNGRWKMVETLTGTPAVRTDWHESRVTVLVNLRARDLNASASTVRIQVSARYSSLFRQDQKVGIDRLSITKKIEVRLRAGRSSLKIRETP